MKGNWLLPPTHPSYRPNHDDILYLESSSPARGAIHEFSPLYRRLALRSPDGALFGVVSYRVFADHYLIMRLLVRKRRVDLGLKLLHALKAEAARARKEAIWLETHRHDSAEAFYAGCGFEKKMYYQVDPDDSLSPVKEIWLLKQLSSSLAA